MDANVATPEVSNDKGPGREDDYGSVESVTPQLTPRSKASAITSSNSSPANKDDWLTEDLSIQFQQFPELEK